MKFAHRDCGTFVAEYIGLEALTPGLMMRAKDWIILGKAQTYGATQIHRCPKCLQIIEISPRGLIEIKE